MARCTQSRKWLITINNLTEHNLSRDEIVDTIMKFHPTYFCLADEISETGTPHTHIFIYSKSPIRFSTLKNRFPVAHIDNAKGTVNECRDYIRKEGKWADSNKAHTKVNGSFMEFGEAPLPNEENSPDMFKLIKAVESGLTTYEIIKLYPKYGFKTNDIDTIRQTILSNKFLSTSREIDITYIFGPTATGKTRMIFDSFPAEDICRITHYPQNGIRFDSYNGHDVLVFEEFASQIPIEDMLNFLDIYPLKLPARYSDKVACYHHVFITSNISLYEQYGNVQLHRSETWQAFLRRINYLIEFTEKGKYKKTTLNKKVVLVNGKQKTSAD